MLTRMQKKLNSIALYSMFLSIATLMFVYTENTAQAGVDITSMNGIEFPWKTGETWLYTGGPHNHYGGRGAPFQSLILLLQVELYL